MGEALDRAFAKWKGASAKALAKKLWANERFLAAAARKKGPAREEFVRKAFDTLWDRWCRRTAERLVNRVDAGARQSARPGGAPIPMDYVLACDDLRVRCDFATAERFREMLAYEATAGVVPEDELAARRRDLELLTPFWPPGVTMPEAVAAYQAAHPDG
jgi:hypothetical protein